MVLISKLVHKPKYQYYRAQNAKKMRKQVTQFAIMIVTFVVFAAVIDILLQTLLNRFILLVVFKLLNNYMLSCTWKKKKLHITV